MGKVNDGGFGVSGSVGPVVFRRRKASTVVAQKPAGYKKSNKPGAKRTNNKFLVMVKFAAAVRKIEVFNPQWLIETKPDRTINNTIHSYNDSKIPENYEFEKASLCPMDGSFPIALHSFEYTGSNLRIELEPLGLLPQNNYNYPSMALAGIFCCRQPIDDPNDKEPFLFVPFLSVDQPIVFDGGPVFNMSLPSANRIKNYQNVKILTCVLFKNRMGGVEKISTSVYFPVLYV